jgi:protein-tyrosine phosphatase
MSKLLKAWFRKGLERLFCIPGDQSGRSLAWVTETLAVGPAPLSEARLDALRAEGITAILNLCEEICDLPGIQTQNGFNVFHLPIPDGDAPNIDQLEQALSWLDAIFEGGGKAYVHCRYGIGRTGMLVHAWLLRRGLSEREVRKRLKNFRCSPQGYAQHRLLRKFRKALARIDSSLEPVCRIENPPDPLAPSSGDRRGKTP